MKGLQVVGVLCVNLRGKLSPRFLASHGVAGCVCRPPDILEYPTRGERLFQPTKFPVNVIIEANVRRSGD
jgi:hypothetical protein